MHYHGDILLGDTINFLFNTASSTGAPTTLSGSPVVKAYLGTSTTEITGGITLTADFDSVTGLNLVTVVATSANGYSQHQDVTLVITTGTVSGVSVVGYVIGSFSIQNRGLRLETGIFRSGGTTTTAPLEANTSASKAYAGVVIEKIDGSDIGEELTIGSVTNPNSSTNAGVAVTGQTWTAPSAGGRYAIKRPNGGLAVVPITPHSDGTIPASLDSFNGVAAIGDGSSGNNIRPTGIPVS